MFTPFFHVANTLKIRYMRKNTAHSGIMTNMNASANGKPVLGMAVKIPSTGDKRYIPMIATIKTIRNFNTSFSKGSSMITPTVRPGL